MKADLKVASARELLGPLGGVQPEITLSSTMPTIALRLLRNVLIRGSPWSDRASFQRESMPVAPL
jgi:hypothetical protein